MNKVSKVWFLPWDKQEKISELLKKTAGLVNLLAKGESVAIKTHFGEEGNDGYIRPHFFKPIIKIMQEAKARAFLTDTNTIYHGQRSNAKDHLAIAAKHGFSKETLGVPIIIADGEGGESYKEIEIGGRHFKKVKIARSIVDADMIIALSHFKGHILAGFGGALKNLGMGCSARVGKFEMHSTVSPLVSIAKCTGCGVCVETCAQKALELIDNKIKLDVKRCSGCGKCIVICKYAALRTAWNEPGKNIQEKFVEYALGAVKAKKIFCITFINHVTPNCDCMSKGETPLVPDIGILASTDPVAIDQAAIDLVLKTAGHDVFKATQPNINYHVQLIYAEKMGLGNRLYKLALAT